MAPSLSPQSRQGRLLWHPTFSYRTRPFRWIPNLSLIYPPLPQPPSPPPPPSLSPCPRPGCWPSQHPSRHPLPSPFSSLAPFAAPPSPTRPHLAAGSAARWCPCQSRCGGWESGKTPQGPRWCCGREVGGVEGEWCLARRSRWRVAGRTGDLCRTGGKRCAPVFPGWSGQNPGHGTCSQKAFFFFFLKGTISLVANQLQCSL